MTKEWETSNLYLKGEKEIPQGITVVGGKTGTTLDAGSCLVLYSETEAKRPYISIVMKASVRPYVPADDGVAELQLGQWRISYAQPRSEPQRQSRLYEKKLQLMIEFSVNMIYNYAIKRSDFVHK